MEQGISQLAESGAVGIAILALALLYYAIREFLKISPAALALFQENNKMIARTNATLERVEKLLDKRI